MAKKHANKKPKVKIKNYDKPVIELIQGMFDNLVENITTMENAIKSLDGALSSYIEFKGDAEKWQKWPEKKHLKNHINRLNQEIHEIKNPALYNNSKGLGVSVARLIGEADSAMKKYTDKLRKEGLKYAKQKQGKG